MRKGEADPNLSSMPLAALERIDAMCVAFESELNTGPIPRIEDYLKANSEPENSVLLRELLHLELAAKESLGLSATQAEYETRFSTFKDVVRAAFSEVTADAPSDYCGQLIAGRYQVDSLIGSGASSDVYLAHDERQQRTVALKILKPHLGVDLEDLLREAETLAELEHPNIVAVYDSGRFDEASFIALEYIGESLAERISSEGPLDPERSVQVTIAICDALQYAHQHGLTHRDIKPHNILMDDNGHPYVADFGFALHESVQDQHHGDRSGTPYYRSPEQVRGEADWIDGRADVWGIGAVLYEMLTGRRPFSGDSIEEIDRQILGRPPKPPRQINPEVPVWLEAVCLKCLSKTSTDRYATATELAKALRDKTHPHKLRFSRRLIATAAAIIFALGGLALAFSWNARSERLARRTAETTALELVEDTIRNLDGPLKKISDSGSTSGRQKIIDNAIETSDRLALKSRYADLLRANTRLRLAELLVDTGGAGNLKTAGRRLNEALDILRKRDAQSRSNIDRTPYLRLFGNIHDALGQIDYVNNDLESAFAQFELAYKFRTEWLDIVQSGVPTNASPFAYAAKDAAPEIQDMSDLERAERAIGDSHNNFGRLYRKDPANSAEALDCFSKSLSAKRTWFESYPAYLPAKRDYAGALRDLAKAQVPFGQYDQAIANFQESIRLTKEVIEEGSANPGTIDLYPPRSNVAVFLSNLGDVLMRSGQFGSAAAPLEEAQRRLAGLLEQHAGDRQKAKYLQRRLGECWYLLGIQRSMESPELARECFENSRETSVGYDRIYPLARLHQRDEAIRLTREAQGGLVGVDRYLLDFAKCFAVCAWSAKEQGQEEEFAEYRKEAIDYLKMALSKGVPSALIRDDLDLNHLCDDSVYEELVGGRFAATGPTTTE